MTKEINLYTPWRGVLIESIQNYYPPNEKTHGLDHALDIERLSLELAQEPEYSHLSLDTDILSAAALLHDAGYSQKKENWSIDQREHVHESMRIAQNLLSEIPLFSENTFKMVQTLWLISNHDNTNYLFPIKGRGGRPAITRRSVSESEGSMSNSEESLAMLAIIKEADSCLATGTKGAERTLQFNLQQGIPLFARGDPLRAWMWGESAFGSVRLAAKRAILDAKTAKGKKIAWDGYTEAENLVRKECERNGVDYHPEPGVEALKNLDREKVFGDLEITRVHPWDELEGVLRQVRLKGDPSLLPYVGARIESHILKVDEVYPLNLYALSKQIDLHMHLRELFLVNYALDLLDLSGVIEFKTSDGDHLISPSLVEISKPDKNKMLLVDGINRFSLARRLGMSTVRSVLVSGVPDHFPLVPLPIEWSEVKILDKVPPLTEKRRFRFSSLDKFPDVSKFSNVEINESIFRYFFYRDFEMLGSSGIRESGKQV